MYNEYVINARDDFESWEPIDTAPTEELAITKAKEYLNIYKQVEVVYSSIDGLENYVVWRSPKLTKVSQDFGLWDDMETGILDDDEEDF